MNVATARLVFDRKHQASRKTTGLVQVEVRYQGRRKFVGTGVKLYAHQWEDGYRVVNHPESVELNAKLSAVLAAIEKLIAQKIEAGEPFELGMIDRLMENRARGESFIEWMEERIEARADIAPNTRRNQRRALNSLKQFGGIKYFSDVTRPNIVMFDDWLHEAHDYKQTTIWDTHKRIQSYVTDAVERGLIKENPYLSLKLNKGRSAGIRYLTMDELKLVEDAAIPTAKIARARDLFVLQCYTGLAYADLVRFDWGKVEQRNGHYVIRDTRRKTDEQYFIVLLEPALAILERYDYQLPIISNQKYNDYLKCVAAMAGVNKPISSHWGRHTFAVMALSLGARMQNVSKMLGHATTAMTEAVYAKVLPEDVINDMVMMEQKIK